MSDHSREPTPFYSLYVLLIACLATFANYYDRSLISILVEPLKHDLHLVDSQIGLLSGIGFVLTYSVLGVPAAQLADRFGRARILAAALAVWSAMIALTGSTVNFTTMLLARAGVGVGEAAGLPASQALVAEHFSEKARGLALAAIATSMGLGGALALVIGGLINDRWGWRAAFWLGGLPGLVLATLVLLTVKDARLTAGPAKQVQSAMKLSEALAALWRRRSYVWLSLGLGIAVVGSWGQSIWAPAFLMRTYHLSASAVGQSFSGVVGLGSIVAIFAGGLINDRLVVRDRRWPLWILASSFAGSFPANLLFLLPHDFRLAMASAVAASIASGLWLAPAFALVQSLAGPRLRATAIALFMMVVNILGLGLGPYLIGFLSDMLAPTFGQRALAISLASLTPSSLVGVFAFLRASRNVVADVASADASPSEAALP